MIRGGIQRAVKLTLEDKLNQDEIMKIDAIFENFSVNYEKFASKHIMQDFYEKLRELQRAWIELKNILASFVDSFLILYFLDMYLNIQNF